MYAKFFGAPPGNFGIFQRSTASSRSHSLVICPPLLGENVWTYWGLKQVAQRAADDGFDVLRFDFSGLGNSLTESSDLDVKDWANDVGSAVDIIAEETGNKKVSIVCVRFSFAFAAQVTLEREIETLVTWDPVISGKSWLDERERDREPHDDGTIDYQGYTLRQEFLSQLRETEARAVDSVQTLAVRTAGHAWDRPSERFGFEELRSTDSWNWGEPVPALFFAHDSVRLICEHLS